MGTYEQEPSENNHQIQTIFQGILYYSVFEETKKGKTFGRWEDVVAVSRLEQSDPARGPASCKAGGEAVHPKCSIKFDSEDCVGLVKDRLCPYFIDLKGGGS